MAEVLIVDDEPGVREAVVQGLSIHGTSCETAENGRRALMKLCAKTAEGRCFDAIILDIVMPDIDGWSVLRAIRNNPLWRDVCVILLTGRANSAADMVRAAENDAMFVEKDADFLTVVRALLGRFDGIGALSGAVAQC